MAEAQDVVTGIIYARNTERALIPAGVDGPLGDLVIASGLIYRKPELTGTPIGTFDLASVTTSVGDSTERRSVGIELSFNKNFARRSWISKLNGPFKNSKQRAELSLNGVETFPLGGGIPDRPIAFGVSTGIGPFVGADGFASIIYDADTQFFTYRFSLA